MRDEIHKKTRNENIKGCRFDYLILAGGTESTQSTNVLLDTFIGLAYFSPVASLRQAGRHRNISLLLSGELTITNTSM
ncbi:hypothetical protein FXF61_03695 [Pseudomonas sp. C27(2019)]|nr:hypothetical protein FXF61_01685 [Pseudomonas sp. C27(2019)]QEY58323.1 hypothetical protein FXF61_03695 [Pseudomonas sp. C27(2019)]